MLFATLVNKFTQDSPRGNFKEIISKGEKTQKKCSRFAFLALKNHNTSLFSNYALCFGVEMHMINTVPFYLSLTYKLETNPAGVIGSLYGLMNVFARSVGSYISDMMFIE